MTDPKQQPVRYSQLAPAERRATRERYIQQQDGKCHHCKAPLDGPPPQSITRLSIQWGAFPPNFRQHPVHLHHSHDTDLTIGAVHMLCNAVLWQYHGE